MSKAKVNKGLAALQDLGFSEEEIRELGLDAEELAVIAEFNDREPVTIDIKLDNSHRLKPEEYKKLMSDMFDDIDTEKTALQLGEMVAMGLKTYVRYKSLGTLG